VTVELPDASRVLPEGGLVILGETYAEHVARLGEHADAYGDDVRVQLEFAASVEMADLVRAQHFRESVARQVEEGVRTRADALLLPTTAIEAPRIGDELTTMDDGSEIPIMSALAAFTLLHNLTRLPTVAVPAGCGTKGLPTSVQVTTAMGEDALALA